jgi:uncharacterized membrane protein YjfL (UPF0719 family)
MGILKKTFKDLLVNLGVNIGYFGGWLIGISLFIGSFMLYRQQNIPDIMWQVFALLGILVIVVSYIFATKFVDNYSERSETHNTSQRTVRTKVDEYKKCINDPEVDDSVCEKILE